MILGRFVEEHQLGRMFMAETGFLIARDPDTVRAPDIAFIRSDHLPDDEPRETYWPGAPDLAVEVVSPGDTVGEVGEKVRDWLDAGSMAVWVVDPRAQTITVYRSPTDIDILTVKDELEGGDVVPGFRCAVAEVFAIR
jgi:Uma2 family endonuclease